MIEVPTGTMFTRYYEDGNPSRGFLHIASK